MAPKRSQGSPKKQPPAKKQKVKQDELGAVSEAIKSFDGINADCREMLVAMAPLSLGITAESRDEHQQAAVRMHQEVFEKIQQKLQEAIAAEEVKVTDVEKTKADLEATVASEEAVLTEKDTVVDTQKQVLVEKTTVTVATKKALKEKTDAQKEGDAQYLQLQSDAAGLEKCFNEDFAQLKAGELVPAQAKKHYSVLLPFAKTMNLDESMMTALPAATQKKKEARGAFDDMVWQELEKSFGKQKVELEAGIAAEAPTAATRAAAVEAAEADHTSAKGAQHAAAQELSAAQAAQKEQAAKVKEAKKAVTGFGPQYAKATADRDKCLAALEEFKSWPLLCFETLRDKVTKAPEPAAADEDPAPAEVPAEEAAEPAAAEA